MANAFPNAVRFLASAPGTSTFTVSSTPAGFFPLTDVTDGDTVYYSASDAAGGREEGYGVVGSSGTTLTRNVVRSTNTNAAVNFTGVTDVAITVLGSWFAARDVLIPPPTSGWSWVNQGSAALNNGARSLAMTAPTQGGTHGLRLQTRSVPGSAFRLTAKLDACVSVAAFAGLFFGDGTHYFAGGLFGASTTECNIFAHTYASTTSAQSTAGVPYQSASTRVKWFRLRDTGTNVAAYFSMDENPSRTTEGGWFELANVSYASAGLSGAPTVYGFGLDPYNDTASPLMLITINSLDIDGNAIS